MVNMRDASSAFMWFMCKLGIVHKYRIYLLLLEPSSPKEKLGDVSWVVSIPRSPVPASLHLCSHVAHKMMYLGDFKP